MPNQRFPGLKQLSSLALIGWLFAIPIAHADAIQDINELFRKGDLNGALTLANQQLAKNPKDAQARFLKGLILADQNKASEAIQVFTSITEDYPELPEPYNNLAVLYASQGKYDAARNALEMAIRTHPSYATAHENLGDLYAKMASQAYDKALQIDGSNRTALTKLALIKEIMSGQPRKTAAAARPEPRAVSAATSTTTSMGPTPIAQAAKPSPVAAPQTVMNPTANRAVSAQTTPAQVPPPQASPAKTPDVAGTVEAWAKAWSERDIDAYLDFYSPDFSPGNMNYSEWAAQRRERIGNANRITVSLSNIKVQQISSNRASVSFKQKYESDRINNTSSKTLDMELADGKWRILRESGR